MYQKKDVKESGGKVNVRKYIQHTYMRKLGCRLIKAFELIQKAIYKKLPKNQDRK